MPSSSVVDAAAKTKKSPCNSLQRHCPQRSREPQSCCITVIYLFHRFPLQISSYIGREGEIVRPQALVLRSSRVHRMHTTVRQMKNLEGREALHAHLQADTCAALAKAEQSKVE